MDTQPFALSFPESLHGPCFPEMEANTFSPQGLGTKQWAPWVSLQWGFHSGKNLPGPPSGHCQITTCNLKPERSNAMRCCCPCTLFVPFPPHSVSFQCCSACLQLCESKRVQPQEGGGFPSLLALPYPSCPLLPTPPPPRTSCALALPSWFQFWMITDNSKETL